MSNLTNSPNTPPTYSIASIIAIVSAVAIFFVGPGWGLVLAIVAIISGVIGMIVALSPKTRGGIASTIAVLLAGAGIVVAILKGLLKLF